MPPKKKVEEKKILLGRPGNNLKVCSLSYFADLHRCENLGFSLPKVMIHRNCHEYEY